MILLRRKYYDAEPIYVREQTPNWYQQLPTTNEFVQKILKDLLEDKAVLEIGCGGGWLARFMLRNNVRKYYGFDFSETAVQNATRRLVKFKNAEIYLGNALKEDSYPKNMVDIVVAHQFAQCLIGSDRTQWLRYARQCLPVGTGKIILSTMVGIPLGVQSIVDPVTKVNSFRNRYFADREEVVWELEQANFEVEKEYLPEPHMAVFIAKTK